MPEIIQLTRWFGCMVSSRLMAWVVLLILSSGTSLKRVRKAFTSLWSKVPWKPTVSILRLYKSSRRLPSKFRYSSFSPSDTESSCSWSGTVSFWERVSTVRSSIQKRGLTFRSAVTGSGVVVDDTGAGVTFFGVQPVLHAAVSLKKFNILILIFLILNEILFSYITLHGSNPCEKFFFFHFCF